MRNVNVNEDENVVSSSYDSLLSFLECDGPDDYRQSHEYKEYINETRSDRSWLGIDNRKGKDVLDHALYGHKAIFESLKDKIAQLNERVGAISPEFQVEQVHKRVRTRGRMGDEIDIHRVNSGRLDTAWEKRVRETSTSKIKLVTLIIDIYHNHTIRADDSIWQAAVAVKMCEDLTKAGKSVRIVVGGASNQALVNSNKYVSSMITAKRYDENITMEKLCGMVYLGFFRVWGFASFISQGKYFVKHHMGYPRQLTINNCPVDLRRDVKAKLVTPIFVKKSLSLWEALESLKDAKSQIESSNEK